MKKILITGGCGYIGSALENKLKSKHIITTVDLEYFGNHNNQKNIKINFDTVTTDFLEQFDVIIHVAANSSVPLCNDIYDAYENNVTKFIKLVNKLHKQKFIYASSSCVYVTGDNKPRIETDILSPMDGLTFTKTSIDQFIPLTDVEYYGLRFGSVNGYSPNMRLDLMVNSMTISAVRENKVSVFNGDKHRPILGINDLVSSVERIIDCDKDHRGVYNLASFNDNILNIGKHVAEYFGVPVIDNGKNFTYDFTISSEKFKQTFDFEFTDSIESIIKTIIDNKFNPLWSKREKYELC